MYLSFDAENQNGIARHHQLQRPTEVAPHIDRCVRACRYAGLAANARLVDDFDVGLRDRNRLHRTHPDTGETGYTLVRVDFKLHVVVRLAERRLLMQRLSYHAVTLSECQWAKIFQLNDSP